MATKPKVPDIPQAEAGDAAQLQRFIEAVREVIQTREGVRGDVLDKAVTFRDLMDLALTSRRPGGGFYGTAGPGAVGPAGPAGPQGPPGEEYVPDYTAPPSPANLRGTSLFKGVVIEWDTPAYTVGHGNAYTELFVAQYSGTGALPTFAATIAVGKAAGQGTIYVHPAAMGAQLHIWAKHVTEDAIASATPAGGTNGVQVTIGRVGNSDLGALIVEADNIAANAITFAKIAPEAVDLTKFAPGIEPISVVSSVPSVRVTNAIFNTEDGKLYRWNGSAYVRTTPTTDLLGQVTNTQITDGAISTPKIAANAVTAAEITAGAITAGKIAVDAVTAGTIAAGAVVAGKIAAGAIAVGSAAIADGAIRNALIENLAVDSAKIADAAVSTAKIGDAQITNAKIGDAQITNAKINNIDASKITAGFIDAARIAAGTVTATMMEAGIMSADNVLTRGMTVRHPTTGAVILSSGVPLQTAVYGTNLLYNGDFAADLDQWVVDLSPAYVESQRGFNFSGFTLLPSPTRGNRSLWSEQGSPVAGGDSQFIEFKSPPLLVAQGDRVIGSAHVGAHRCTVHCFIFGFDSAGSLVYIFPAAATTHQCTSGEANGGATLGLWKRIYEPVTIGANIASVRLVIRKYNTNAGQGNSYLFATRAMLEKSAPLASAPSPWAPPSDTAKITAANAPTFIDSAAIGWAQIGDLVINTAGGIRSGKTAFGSGTGWLIEYNGGNPRIDIGDSNYYFRYSPATGPQFRVADGQLDFDNFTATVSGGDASITLLGSNSHSDVAKTLSVTGGKAPLRYIWMFDGQYGRVVGGQGTATVTIRIVNQNGGGTYVNTAVCFIRDANGRVTIASFDIVSSHVYDGGNAGGDGDGGGGDGDGGSD